MATYLGTARFVAALVFGAWLVGGCASMNPPELDGASDDDQYRCLNDPRPAAIAACQRIVARPDVSRWPGSISYASTAYWVRAHAAWHLARYLAADDRNEESLAAALRSVELFERYDRERHKSSSAEYRSTSEGQTATFNAYLARAEYAAGLQLVRLRRWPEALPHLQRVVELDGRPAVAWATLGVAANQLEDYASSTRAFDKALELEPGYFTEPRAIQRQIFDASRDGRRLELDARAPAGQL